MAKYHVVDGDVRPCRATKRACPKSDAHFEDAKDARAWFEKDAAIDAKIAEAMGKRRNPAPALTVRALTKNLSPKNFSKPAWMGGNSGIDFSDDAEIIDVIPGENGEKLVVVWQESDGNDPMGEMRGYQLPIVSLHELKSGERRGYLRSSFVSDETFENRFGNDEWASLRYLEEFDGGIYHVFESDETPRGENPIQKDKWLNAQSDGERLELKKKIWASFSNFYRLKAGFSPENWDELQRSGAVSSWSQLSPKHAPDDEGQLDRDLAKIREFADKEVALKREALDVPFVDYSNVDDSYKGKGYGQALYAYSARMLGERLNMPLSGSGLQSDDAIKAWDRMLMTDGFKMGKADRKKFNGTPCEPTMQLDYRNNV